MAENFKKNIGTLRCEEARSYYSKNNIWQKLVFWKLISTCLHENFQRFYEKSKTLKFYSDFEPKIFGRVFKTAFYEFKRRTFWEEKTSEKVYNFFQILSKKSFGFLAEKIRHGYQNCILHVQRNYLWIFFSKKKIIL